MEAAHWPGLKRVCQDVFTDAHICQVYLHRDGDSGSSGKLQTQTERKKYYEIINGGQRQ